MTKVHTISIEDLEGEYRTLLASSSGYTRKRLYSILKVSSEGGYGLWFEVSANGTVVTLGQNLQAAVRRYSELT